MPRELLSALLRRHGTRIGRVLGEATGIDALGKHFGGTLYAAEIDYLVAQEWARTADDVLWRRTKCGLHLDAGQRDAVAAYLREQYGHK
jgi:glycerol-3-phosphate dehydrogenase